MFGICSDLVRLKNIIKGFITSNSNSYFVIKSSLTSGAKTGDKLLFVPNESQTWYFNVFWKIGLRQWISDIINQR